jgi:hypothetical protein
LFGVVRVVIRRVIADIVSLQEEMVVGGLYYGSEELTVVERKMRGFKNEW